MGENELAILNGETVLSWKSNDISRIDSKWLMKEKPDLYQKYVNTTSSKRFLVK